MIESVVGYHNAQEWCTIAIAEKKNTIPIWRARRPHRPSGRRRGKILGEGDEHTLRRALQGVREMFGRFSQLCSRLAWHAHRLKMIKFSEATHFDSSQRTGFHKKTIFCDLIHWRIWSLPRRLLDRGVCIARICRVHECCWATLGIDFV